MCFSLSKRVSVGLSDETYKVIVRLSEANGESMSSILSGLADAMAPALDRVATVVETVEAARAAAHSEVLTRLAVTSADVTAELEPVMSEAVRRLSAGLDTVSAAGRPPSSNTGVR